MADLIAAQVFNLGGTYSNWALRLASYMTKEADLARRSAGMSDSGRVSHAAALEHVASQLRIQAMSAGIDTALHLLASRVFVAIGQGFSADQNSYKPSPQAANVIASIGRVPGVSWSDYVLAILAGEIEDLSKRDNALRQSESQAQRDREEAVVAQRHTAERLNVVTATLSRAEQELAAVRAERDELRSQRDFLRRQLEIGRTPHDESAAEPATEHADDDFPTEEQLTVALTKRVKVAPGLYLQRHKDDTWFAARIGPNEFYWIAPATQGLSISQAVDARQRIVESRKAAE